MKLSEIVRRYREEHGLSIRQFAKQCDISHSAIANIENETNSYGNGCILKCPRRTGPGARRVEGSRQLRAEKEQNARKLMLQIESYCFNLLCSAAVQHQFVQLVRLWSVSCLCAVPAIGQERTAVDHIDRFELNRVVPCVIDQFAA